MSISDLRDDFSSNASDYLLVDIETATVIDPSDTLVVPGNESEEFYEICANDSFYTHLVASVNSDDLKYFNDPMVYHMGTKTIIDAENIWAIHFEDIEDMDEFPEDDSETIDVTQEKGFKLWN